MRSLLAALLLMLCLLPCTGARADSLSASVDLGTVTLTYNIAAGSANSGSYAPQLFLHNVEDGTWIVENPKVSVQVPSSGTFTFTGLSVGHYDQIRLILFLPNYVTAYDHTFTFTPNFYVATKHIRVNIPQMSFSMPYVGSDNQLHIPWTIIFPLYQQLPSYTGVWIMAKGNGGGGAGIFVQDWAHLDWAQVYNDPSGDVYYMLTGEMLTGVPPNGVAAVQGGAFDYWWNGWVPWIWPGPTFEIGGNSWIQRCNPALRPTVANALKRVGKAPWSIGGDLGNYTCFAAWGTYNNYADPYYMGAVRLAMKAQWLRENLDPDRYLVDQTYRDIIRSHAEAMWMAGVVPIFAMQGMPQGDTLAEQDAALVAVDTQLAQDYADAPNNVILENCNEPYQHPNWTNDWKPEAIATLSAMYAVDPKGHFLCATEGHSGSVAAANADPLPNASGAVYDVHAYVPSSQITATCGGTLPVMVTEYYDTSGAFHNALQSLHNVIGIGAWAWSEAGQDGLALVQSQNGLQATLQPVGAALAAIYQTIIAGGMLH